MRYIMSKQPLTLLNSLCCHLVVIFLGKQKGVFTLCGREMYYICSLQQKTYATFKKKAPIITFLFFNALVDALFSYELLPDSSYFCVLLLLLAWPQISAVCATVHFKKKTNRLYHQDLLQTV